MAGRLAGRARRGQSFAAGGLSDIKKGFLKEKGISEISNNKTSAQLNFFTFTGVDWYKIKTKIPKLPTLDPVVVL